ncbi:fibronectin type III domain-containing protein [Neobacillus sp. LXY-4]|uniref:fibronectin type III domain-containing protein n=1 Tax=Neobacillus sp. LXY-4 TaxID=3379826 RepID=UPI003EDF2E51
MVAVATGNSHTVGLKDDGTLVFVGYDSYGLISDAREWTNIIAISACRDHQVGLKNDGTVVANGDFTDGAKNISQWKDIVAISSGYNHVVGLKRDGTVVATRNIPDDQILSTENISVNKKVVKPNDLVNIDLRNNGLYTIQDNQFQLMNGDTVLFDGQMTIDGETDRAISYTVKPSDIGNITLKFPGVYDLFGNPVTKQNAFQVIPLQSLVSSKIQTKSGDKITLTATFYQSVKPDFTVELSGGADLQATQMNEVVGSNGTKFTLDYTVPSNYVEGQVDAAVQNVTTADGTVYGSYTENAVFAKTNNPLPIQSLTASKTLGKIGDKITITADFSESVKPGVQITLVGENFTLPSATMTEVTGSNGKKYIYTYPVVVNVNGPISAHITNAYDQNGSLYGEYQHSNLFVSDGMPPYVKGMSASATTGKLGDKVVITATFSEPIKPIVKLSFYYGAVLSPTVMKEVPGTNQTQYSYEYTIDQYATGPVYADIRDVEDLAGNKYPGINRDGRYFTFNLFNPDGVKPTVQTFSSDKNIYEAGDVASFTATLSEPVKSGVKIKLSGAINEEYEMTQVDGKTYEFYYVIPNDLFGNVNVELLNIEDLVGNTNQYSKSNAFFISDPTNAKLSAISIKSGTVTYPLSPSFSPEVYEYRTTVPSIVSSINVGAITEDLNASVTGLGTVNVKLGDNVILLTSTSKDGTKKTYKLIVTVKDIAPTNVKASSNSYNSVKLTWSAVSGASGYEIYRSTSSTGTFSKIASTASTAYINTSVNTGTTYYYKVRAYKTGTTTKYSKFSSVVSAKPIPATPSSVKAASSSYNSIKTSWAAVAGASGYEVYRATSSTGTYSRIGTTTATSYNNTGLTTNKSYFYKVRAYRTVGTTKVYSNYSSVVSAKPIPSVPTNFKATRVSSTSLKLTWSSVSGASGYEIYRATSSTGTYSLLKSTASLYYTNSSLTTGKTYFYKARAYRMVGTTKVYSGWTTVISARP